MLTMADHRRAFSQILDQCLRGRSQVGCHRRLQDPREHLNLLGGRADACDLALEASVADQFDREVEHQTVRVLLRQSVYERTPGGILYQLSQPRGRLSLLGKDGVCLLGVKGLEDHIVKVVLNQLLHGLNLSPS